MTALKGFRQRRSTSFIRFEGQRTFFFSNWITDYNAQQLANEVAKMRDKLRADDWTEEEKAFKRQLIALYKLIGENVRIENGPFYLNGEGKLSATQEVTVTKVSDLAKVSFPDCS